MAKAMQCHLSLGFVWSSWIFSSLPSKCAKTMASDGWRSTRIEHRNTIVLPSEPEDFSWLAAPRKHPGECSSFAHTLTRVGDRIVSKSSSCQEQVTDHLIFVERVTTVVIATTRKNLNRSTNASIIVPMVILPLCAFRPRLPSSSI